MKQDSFWSELITRTWALDPDDARFSEQLEKIARLILAMKETASKTDSNELVQALDSHRPALAAMPTLEKVVDEAIAHLHKS